MLKYGISTSNLLRLKGANFQLSNMAPFLEDSRVSLTLKTGRTAHKDKCHCRLERHCVLETLENQCVYTAFLGLGLQPFCLV